MFITEFQKLDTPSRSTQKGKSTYRIKNGSNKSAPEVLPTKYYSQDSEEDDMDFSDDDSDYYFNYDEGDYPTVRQKQMSGKK